MLSDRLSNSHAKQLTLMLFIAALGVAVIVYQTRNGPAIGGDSVQYVMGAQNLLDGNGYSRLTGGGGIVPVTGFPPFYSTVLASVGLVGIDLYQAAKILNAIFFGGSLLLVSLFMLRATGSVWLSTLANLLIISSTSVLTFYGMVMTEPLYIFLTLLVLYGLVKHLDIPNRLLLILLAILVGATILTRYVGASLLATGVLGILLFNRTSRQSRILDATIFSGIALLPLFLWFRRNSMVGESLTNRVLRFHWMRPEVIRGYFAEVLSWFVPRVLGFPRPIRNLLVALIALPVPIAFLVSEVRRRFWRRGSSSSDIHHLPWILIFYIASYLGILVANSTFLDAGTSQGAIARYLLPVFYVSVMLFVIIVQRLLSASKRPSIGRTIALGYAGLLISFSIVQSIPQITQPDLIYLDYMRKREEVVQELQSIDSETTIITNNQEMIYLMGERGAFMWPIQFDQYQQQDRQDYEQQLDATRDKLNQGGVLVVFGWPVGTEDLVFDVLGTERLASFIDVTFLGYPETLAK
jgi:hypothetical protein